MGHRDDCARLGLERHSADRRRMMSARATHSGLAVLAILAILAVGVSLPVPARAATMSSLPTAMWDTNGMVNAVLPVGHTIYAGGRFTLIGRHTGGGAPVSRATGLPVTPFPVLNGSVYAAAADGHGGYFAGGSFTIAASTARFGLMHVRADGSVDPRWNLGVSGSVLTLAVSGSTVYAGGDFRSIGGRSRNRIAALDATTGHLRSWNPGANGTVRTIAVSGSTVFAGGSFTAIAGRVRRYLAVLSARTGRATAWNAAVAGAWNAAVAGVSADGSGVATLAVAGSTVVPTAA